MYTIIVICSNKHLSW